MVLPGTFMPFFFPMGIAFMGAQSAVMMKMAGEQWQFGKRRISAMSNEDFNKLTSLKLYEIETSELRQMIPTMKKSFDDMTALNPVIVNAMIQMAKDFVQSLLNAAQSGDGLAGYIWRLIWQIPGEPGTVGELPSSTQETKGGKSEDFDTLPAPGEKPTEKMTEAQKQKDLDSVNKLLKDRPWQKFVTSGQTRRSIIALIKAIESGLDDYYKFKKEGKYKNKIDKIIANTILILRHHKDALLWLNNQGTGGAKVTP